jgi:thymidylate kinase
MTPADRELVTRIRAALPRQPVRVALSGLDGVGKSTQAAMLADALGLPVVRVPDRDRVAALAARDAAKAGVMHPQLAALHEQLIEAPASAILDRGPLCVAAIHPMTGPWPLYIAQVEGVFTILLDLPLAEARARKPDPEAELRDRDREAARYRELAARWPRTVVIDASRPPGEVLSAALAAVARAVGVAT